MKESFLKLSKKKKKKRKSLLCTGQKKFHWLVSYGCRNHHKRYVTLQLNREEKKILEQYLFI